MTEKQKVSLNSSQIEPIDNVDFRLLPLRELCQSIADGSDLAFNEFMEHRCIYQEPTLSLRNQSVPVKGILFGSYIESIREKIFDQKWWKDKGTEFIDRAIELLIARFTNLPFDETEPCPETLNEENESEEKDKADTTSSEENENKETDGCNVDRRVYFKAFVDSLEKSYSEISLSSEVEREQHDLLYLQRFIWRQLSYCLQESAREKRPFINRYTWNIGAIRFVLWFPKAFSGKRRKQWLEEHIGQPDLQKDKERERKRIQAIIDDYFGIHAACPMDDMLLNKTPSRMPGANISLEREDCTTMRSLIAHEKAAGAYKLLPTISCLGYDRIYALVMLVLDNIVSELYSDDEIAKRFGLSKSTFSRFAGSHRWKKFREGYSNKPPILAENSAQILRKHKDFFSTAQEMGLIKETQNKEVHP